jgi:hypothetical protein
MVSSKSVNAPSPRKVRKQSDPLSSILQAFPAPSSDGNIYSFMGDRQAEARHASSDYCFNHFQSFRERGLIFFIEGGGSINGL